MQHAGNAVVKTLIAFLGEHGEGTGVRSGAVRTSRFQAAYRIA
jgi:hypothetical protein